MRKLLYMKESSVLIKEKAQNGTTFPTSQRDQVITDILRIQSDGSKSVRDYEIKNKYGVLKIGKEKIFDAINAAHQKIDHGGEKKTFLVAQNQWTNVTQEAYYLFLTFYEECHKKRARKLFQKP
ncbi:KRAB-A domain-containing protein 2 [Trichinella nelsoni]|uniref:KRAB-A domain-containing protein 2 n=1 Tax=Trichinella nelsoni TaxID=6336 RepID=A0A0V0SEX3_9BILA|nr:KRAB-A domain-containing protein 2 [Trichinella nelsoni]